MQNERVLLTDLFNALPGNSSVNTVQHGIEKGVTELLQEGSYESLVSWRSE
jgi:hypothetical protein